MRRRARMYDNFFGKTVSLLSHSQKETAAVELKGFQ